MGLCVCASAIAQCPFGVAPTPLTFLQPCCLGSAGPLGTCVDTAPFVIITPIGVCSSLMNPITAAQTAAAFGVLTPGVCIPTPVSPWVPMKPNVIASTGPILTNDSMVICAYGGVIKINVPMQFTVMV